MVRTKIYGYIAIASAVSFLAFVVFILSFPRQYVFVKTRTDILIEELIECESNGKNVAVIDSNGEYSYGILQFQGKTWSWMSEESGITGSPMDEADAVRMAVWAVNRGYGSHWTCWYIMGLDKL